MTQSLATQSPAPLVSAPDQLSQRLYDRYRHNIPTDPIWNETLDTLLSHRSVRSYRDQAVSLGIVELAIAAAQSAATSSNLQPWSVIAVTDPDRKARLAVLAGDQQQIHDAPVFLLWLVDHRRLADSGDAEGTPAKALDYLESLLLGAVDTSLAAQNAVLALESAGLGTCYIGGIRNNPQEVAAELGLPPQVFALFGLTIGYPNPEKAAAVKPRLPLSTVFFHEHYGADNTPADLAAYNHRLRSFQREQQMQERDWTEQISQRLRGPESLAGRHLLSDALNNLGFKIL